MGGERANLMANFGVDFAHELRIVARVLRAGEDHVVPHEHTGAVALGQERGVGIQTPAPNTQQVEAALDRERYELGVVRGPHARVQEVCGDPVGALAEDGLAVDDELKQAAAVGGGVLANLDTTQAGLKLVRVEKRRVGQQFRLNRVQVRLAVLAGVPQAGV